VWFVAYRHSIRIDEAGVKFVYEQDEAAIVRQSLETRGYVVTNTGEVSPSSLPWAKCSPPHQRD